MKNIIKIITLLLFMYVISVNASELTYKVNLENGKYHLNFVDEDDNLITYEEAKNKYDIDDYIRIIYKSTNIYFYKGKEISKKEYKKGNNVEVAKKKAKSYNNFGKYVSTTNEAITEIKKIFKNGELGTYHLIYPNINEIDFDYIEEYYKNNYLTNLNKKLFTYKEYGIKHPINTTLKMINNEIIVENNNIKITNYEQQQVDNFMKKFSKYFVELNDYEKIYCLYNFILENITYENKKYENYIDGNISVYDALVKKKADKMGYATAFSYLLDYFKISNYIVDFISVNGKFYPYNIVKLNNNWYIVDIYNKEFLKGKTSKTYNENDYGNIKISDYDCEIKEVNFKIDTNELYDIQVEQKSDKFIEYLLLILILSVIALTIALLSKPKKK